MSTRKRVGLEFEISTNDTAKELAEVELRLNQISQEIKKAKKEADGETYADLRKEQLRLQESAKNLRREFRDTVKDFNAQDFPDDSIIALRRQYIRLKNELLELSTTDPNFQQKAKDANRLSDRLKDLEKSLGDTRRNVGNYEEDVTAALESVGSALEGNITALAQGLGAGSAVVLGIDLVARGLEQVRQISQEVVQLQGELNRVTGLQGEALERESARVQALITTFGFDQAQLIESAQAAAKGFGITFSQALDAIEKGALSGADAQGELLRQFAEYPKQIANAGGSVEDFVKLLTQQVEGGIFDDKLIDTIKETDLALKEFTATQREALAPLGEDFVNNLNEGIRTGQVSTLEAIQSIATRADELGLDLQQLQTITADVFKGAGEDAGGFANVVENVFLGLQRDYSGLIDETNKLTQAQQAQLQANEELASAQAELAESLGNTDGQLSTLTTRIRAQFLEGLAGIITRGREILAFFRPVVVEIRRFGEVLGIVDKQGRLTGGALKVISVNGRILRGILEVLAKLLETGFKRLANFAQGIRNIAESIGLVRSEQDKTQRDLQLRQGQINQTTDNLLQALKQTKTETKELGEETEKTGDKTNDFKNDLETLTTVADKVAKTGLAALKAGISQLRTELESAPDAASYLKVLERLEAAELRLAQAQARRQRFVDRQRGFGTAAPEIQGSGIEAGEAADAVLGATNLEDQAELERQERIQRLLLESKKNFENQLIEQTKAARDEELEIEERFFTERAQYFGEAAEQFGETLGQLAQDGELTLKEFNKVLVTLALDAAEKVVNLAIAELFAKQVASQGFAGLAKAAILQGLLKGFTSVIFGAVRNSLSDFADGGLVELGAGRITDGQRVPSTRKGDNMLAYVKQNELILNEQQQAKARAFYGGDIWRRLGVPGFNQGGLVPQLISPAASSGNGIAIEDAQIAQLAEQISRRTAEETARATGQSVANAIFEARERSERLENLRKSSRI